MPVAKPAKAKPAAAARQAARDVDNYDNYNYNYNYDNSNAFNKPAPGRLYGNGDEDDDKYDAGDSGRTSKGSSNSASSSNASSSNASSSNASSNSSDLAAPVGDTEATGNRHVGSSASYARNRPSFAPNQARNATRIRETRQQPGPAAADYYAADANRYVVHKRIQRDTKIERAIEKLIDKVVGFEAKNKTARFYTMQSLLEKVVRSNPQFYIGIMHPYIEGVEGALERARAKVASLAGWTGGGSDTRAAPADLAALKQIADDLVILAIDKDDNVADIPQAHLGPRQLQQPPLPTYEDKIVIPPPPPRRKGSLPFPAGLGLR